MPFMQSVYSVDIQFPTTKAQDENPLEKLDYALSTYYEEALSCCRIEIKHLETIYFLLHNRNKILLRSNKLH